MAAAPASTSASKSFLLPPRVGIGSRPHVLADAARVRGPQSRALSASLRCARLGYPVPGGFGLAPSLAAGFSVIVMPLSFATATCSASRSATESSERMLPHVCREPGKSAGLRGRCTRPAMPRRGAKLNVSRMACLLLLVVRQLPLAVEAATAEPEI
jgi:hypothetical protein